MTRKTKNPLAAWTTPSGSVVTESDADRLAEEFEQDDAALDRGRVTLPRKAGAPRSSVDPPSHPRSPSASRPNCARKPRSSRPNAERLSPALPVRHSRNCSGAGREIP